MLELERLQERILPNLGTDDSRLTNNYNKIKCVEDILQEMCSDTVLKYWNQIGWKPSLQQLVVMIAHGERFFRKQMRWLLALRDFTDGELHKQICAWLDAAEKYIQCFENSTDRDFFDIVAEIEDEKQHFSAKSFTRALSIAQGIHDAHAITIYKREFTGEDDFSPEAGYSSDSVGFMSFDAEGFFEWCWSYKMSFDMEDKIVNSRFFVPHPFKNGDVVVYNDYGGFKNAKAIFHGPPSGVTAEEHFNQRRYISDEYEEQAIIEILDKDEFFHWHCHPYRLDFATDDGSAYYDALRCAGLLINGKAYLQEIPIFISRYLKELEEKKE